MFGVAQLSSILISFVSLIFSVIHFNELEAKSVKSAGKFFLGLPFFLITIVFRTIAFSLLLCFLGWWSSCIIFLIFFTTVLTSVCIGDNFFRACVYGVWSFLVPVGYTKDPLEPLDYKKISNEGFIVFRELYMTQTQFVCHLMKVTLLVRSDSCNYIQLILCVCRLDN